MSDLVIQLRSIPSSTAEQTGDLNMANWGKHDFLCADAALKAADRITELEAHNKAGIDHVAELEAQITEKDEWVVELDALNIKLMAQIERKQKEFERLCVLVVNHIDNLLASDEMQEALDGK